MPGTDLLLLKQSLAVAFVLPALRAALADPDQAVVAEVKWVIAEID